jgi:hypothetical protein
VAEAIAAAAGVAAEPMDQVKAPIAADLLFLGSAVYAIFDHSIDPAVKGFIESLDPKKVSRVALFCTGFSEDAIRAMKGLLEWKGFDVLPDTFYCRGKLFVIFNFGHPNRTDLQSAERFARSLVKG